MNLKPEQLALRRTGITGTDLPAILGLSAFATPLDVFLDKRGLLPPKEVTEDMERGTFLEDGARKWYAHRTGALRVEEPGTVVSPRNPLVIATPDGVAHFRDDVRALEIKMPGNAVGWGEPGTDAIPEWYLPQVAWELAALDMQRADVFAVLDGKPRIYHVTRDVELEGLLVEEAERFWRDHVVTGKPPEVTARDVGTVSRWLRRNETSEHLRFEALPPESQVVLEEYLRAYRECSDAEECLALWAVRAKLLVGTAPGVAGLPLESGFSRLDWRHGKGTETVDMKAFRAAVASKGPGFRRRAEALLRQYTKTREGNRPFTPRAITKRGER